MDPLIVDIYSEDLNGKPNIQKLVDAGPPWHGLILKCSEGLSLPTTPTSIGWFNTHWAKAKDLAKDRYGQDWFRGCYHYLRLNADPLQQADFYLSTIEKAGGWGKGDLFPIVDVEGAGNPVKPGKNKLEDCVSKFADRIKSKHGRAPILYGNIYLWENGVTSNCNCQLLWVARYTNNLPSAVYTRIGWPLSKLFGWQYTGTGDPSPLPKGYPDITPLDHSKQDITALTLNGGDVKALEWLRANLFAEDPAQK